MKISAIRERREFLEHLIHDSKTALTELQQACKHPPKYLEKVAKANTGNWCSGDDSYWYNFDCSLCGKHWREDQ